MKLGRNFTNTLIPEVLQPEEREKVISGEIDLFSMNALGLLDFKRDLIFQVESAAKLGLDWLEVDCDIPNPYLDYSADQIEAVRRKAEDLGICLSVHLSYSGMGKEVASIQDPGTSTTLNIPPVFPSSLILKWNALFRKLTALPFTSSIFVF